MKLSRRLSAVKQYIPPGSAVADIGCDRGELSLALLREGIAEKVILSDISPQSLYRAERYFAGTAEAQRAEFRVGNGLQVLAPGEADYAVFAGMGGLTVCAILREGRAVIDALKGMILQAQGNSDKVRALLAEIGFCLKDECMVEEDGKFYTVLHAVPGTLSLDETELFAGPFLLRRRDAVLKAHLAEEKAKSQRILAELSQRGQGEARQEELRRYLELIETAEKRMEEADEIS